MGCAASMRRTPSCGRSQLSFVFSNDTAEAPLPADAQSAVLAWTRRPVALLGPSQQQPHVPQPPPSARQPLPATAWLEPKAYLSAAASRFTPTLQSASAGTNSSRSPDRNTPAISTLSPSPLLPGVSPQRVLVHEDELLCADLNTGRCVMMTQSDRKPSSDSVSYRSLGGSTSVQRCQRQKEYQQPQQLQGSLGDPYEVFLSPPMPSLRLREDYTQADLRICRLMRRSPSGELTRMTPWPNQARHAVQSAIFVINTADDPQAGGSRAVLGPGHAVALLLNSLTRNGANDPAHFPVMEQFRLSTSDRRRIESRCVCYLM
ncbi:hypothetical protein CUR178_04544 [Leishmania enriettii]|uniref:Uncharacterized protein n=1 Tax=Leishmania enriettii TaxID=5663 RepID=A0A836GJW7_LEIEN|nr:hypothetical protein CUR178_04544 [Leishmania enriettii]